MITVTFLKLSNGMPEGFEISGHSGAGTVGNDIICASVSSAAYLTANTLLEVFKVDAKATVRDGYMKFTVPEAQASTSEGTLKGFELHIKALSEQYPDNLKITEV